MAAKKKKPFLAFGKLETRDDALLMIEISALRLYAIAALKLVVFCLAWFVLWSAWKKNPPNDWTNSFTAIFYSWIAYALFYALGGFLLARFKSRIVAVVILVMSLLDVGMLFADGLGSRASGWMGMIAFALLVLWTAVRAVESTFKLHDAFAPIKKPVKAS